MTESYDIDVEICDEGQFSGHSPVEETASTMLMAQTGNTATIQRAGIKRNAPEREEMVMRKKLRNRESAQRARDRQKAKMRWLEEELQRMKIKNEQLLRENLILRHMVQDKPTQTTGPVINQQALLNNLPKTATPQAAAFNAQQVQAQAQAVAQLRQQQQLQRAQQQVAATNAQILMLKLLKIAKNFKNFQKISKFHSNHLNF
jgi:hypothetical protein